MPDRPAAGSSIRVVRGVGALARDHERLLFAVGVFDGLHRGHRYLLARLRAAARRHAALPAVITFDAHPDAIILGHAPPLLLDPEERLGRLATAGIAVTVVQHFDDELRRTPYDVFVGRIAARTHLAGFLMTPDAAFGHERRGTPEALAELGRDLGYVVDVVTPYRLEDGPVRSGRIRESIAAGDLAGAARLLGRGVAITGTATPAQSVGGAWLAVVPALPVALPPDGRYAVTVERPWTASGPGGGGRRPVGAMVADGVLLIPPGAARPGRRVRVRIDRSAS
jgi:riboflavin kinase/FMN adenylyltransferase